MAEIAKREKAIALYEEGAEKEATGLLREAISKYAAALRVHRDVEKFYREKVQKEYLSQSFSKLRLTEATNATEEQELAKTSDDEQMEEEAIEPCWLLEILTDDILLEIIAVLIYTSPRSHVALASTCSRLGNLSFDSSIYKHLCQIIYPRQRYSSVSTQLNNITSNQLKMVENWDFNWESMLNDRPFIKYHGLYISKVSYISEGNNAFSFYHPVKLVTYFRYWRFYPDGQVLKLTTTDEPKVVVPLFNREHKDELDILKDAIVGRFSIDIDGLLVIRRVDNVANYQFKEQLQVVSLGYRKFHRLNWIDSSIINSDGDENYFNLKKEKPFNFSGVLSYKVIYDDDKVIS